MKPSSRTCTARDLQGPPSPEKSCGRRLDAKGTFVRRKGLGAGGCSQVVFLVATRLQYEFSGSGGAARSCPAFGVHAG